MLKKFAPAPFYAQNRKKADQITEDLRAFRSGRARHGEGGRADLEHAERRDGGEPGGGSHGDDVADPPADVPALSDSAGESAEKALTIKDLLAKHRQKESCRDCHARLDPWGIPFEHYNAIGKYQPLVPKEGVRVSGFNLQTHGDLAGYADYLKTINTERVDATARVPRGPEVNGMADLKAYLQKDRRDEIAENLLRRLLSYSFGRDLTPRDRFAVDAMLQESATHEHRLLDMIVTICQSPLFKGEERK